MGFNTTIMLHNDAYDQFKDNPEETMENLLKAMDNVPHERYHYGVGNHANPMKVMRSRHSSDSSIYVHMGNTLCEMTAYSKEAEELMENHPEFFKDMLDRMDYNVKELKKRFKSLNKK